MKQPSRALRHVMAVSLATVAFSGAGLGSSEALVIYNASDGVNSAVLDAFKKAHPEIAVEFVSGSTGPITQRAIAEKANPQADVVYLVNNIALEQLKNAGVFEPYQPVGSKLRPEFRDPDGFYNMYFATTMCMVVNTDRLKEKQIPMPDSWEDLIRPVYKNEISLPSPLKSGTGGAILTTFVDAFGWNFVENLNENVFKWADGGSGGAELAAAGEVAIGLSYDTTCYSQKSAGRPVEIVYGGITPYVSEGGGLVANAPNPEEAKIFLDFMASEAVAEVLDGLVGATAVPGFGLVDLDQVALWQMRRPVDIEEFRREFAERFDQQ